MYYYKFNGDKLIHTLIADAKPEGYACFAGDPLAGDDGRVDWTQVDSDGLTLTAKPVPPVPEPYVPTPEEIAAQTRAQLEFEVDNFMDSKARERGFRDRHSFALRAGITGSSWHDQAQVFGAWMDAVNDYCWQVLKDCGEGKRTVPTADELLAELPVLEG